MTQQAKQQYSLTDEMVCEHTSFPSAEIFWNCSPFSSSNHFQVIPYGPFLPGSYVHRIRCGGFTFV